VPLIRVKRFRTFPSISNFVAMVLYSAKVVESADAKLAIGKKLLDVLLAHRLEEIQMRVTFLAEGRALKCKGPDVETATPPRAAAAEPGASHE
jgi:hypothetical protein